MGTGVDCSARRLILSGSPKLKFAENIPREDIKPTTASTGGLSLASLAKKHSVMGGLAKESSGKIDMALSGSPSESGQTSKPRSGMSLADLALHQTGSPKSSLASDYTSGTAHAHKNLDSELGSPELSQRPSIAASFSSLEHSNNGSSNNSMPVRIVSAHTVTHAPPGFASAQSELGFPSREGSNVAHAPPGFISAQAKAGHGFTSREGSNVESKVGDSVPPGFSKRKTSSTFQDSNVKSSSNVDSGILSGFASIRPVSLSALAHRQNIEGKSTSGFGSQENVKPMKPSTKAVSLLQLASEETGRSTSLSELVLKHEMKKSVDSTGLVSQQQVKSSDSLPKENVKSISLAGLATQHSRKPLSDLALQQNVKSGGLAGLASQHSVQNVKSSNQISLSDLAAQYHIDPCRPTGALPTASPTATSAFQNRSGIKVKSAKGSSFSRTLCMASVAPCQKIDYLRYLSKLAYSDNSWGNSIVPFDFSSPSPDDIVQQKQRAAFGTNIGPSKYLGAFHDKD